MSQASIASGQIAQYGLKKRVEAVKGCRRIGKKDMKWNDMMPKMKVDPEAYTVECDGVVLRAEPSERLPLTQQYFVF